MTHLSFEQINELADSMLALSGSHRAAGSSGAASHLAECPECQRMFERVQQLIVSARALPREVAPPPEVWPALRDRVTHRPSASRRRWSVAAWIAAAAAVVLLVGSALLMPRGAGKAKATKLARLTPTATPVLLAVERHYVATVTELRGALEQQRSTLRPATIRVLEHSLATIDTAIAEARDALASDPGNQTILDILSANYERKVELLQRATELSPSS